MLAQRRRLHATRAAACCSAPRATRDAARIIVSDNGRGIAPADQARVFDRFHRTVEGRGERARRRSASACRSPASSSRRMAARSSCSRSRARGRRSPSACRAPPSSAPTMAQAAVHDHPARRCGGDRGVRRGAGARCCAPATSSRCPATLGAGKTTLARGLLRGARPSRAKSPARPSRSSSPMTPPDTRLPLWHVDLYRIEDAGELDELGLDDALGDGGAADRMAGAAAGRRLARRAAPVPRRRARTARAP